MDDFLLMILTLSAFLIAGIAIMIFCIKRVLLHQNELRKKLPKEKRLFEKSKLNIMMMNLIASVIWVVFFAIRAALAILQYVR